MSKAWGKLHVGSVKPKHVIQLRDAWAETPVAANHLLSVLKTLINWGIPREFSETNPCIGKPDRASMFLRGPVRSLAPRFTRRVSDY